MAGGRAPPPRERLRRRGGRKVWDEEEEEGEVGMARWQGWREGGNQTNKTLSSSSFSPPSPFGAKLELEEVSESTGRRSRKRRRWKVHPTPRFPHRRGEGHQRSNFWCCEISTLLQEGWPKPLSFLGKQETAKAYCTCDARRGEKEGIRERKRFPFYLFPSFVSRWLCIQRRGGRGGNCTCFRRRRRASPSVRCCCIFQKVQNGKRGHGGVSGWKKRGSLSRSVRYKVCKDRKTHKGKEEVEDP